MEMELSTDYTKRILSLTFIFILISTFIVLLIGNAVRNVHEENKELNEFLNQSQNIHQNFERSLKIYTENTQRIIKELFTLRPSNQEQFILFISQVENIGSQIGVNLDLRSVENTSTQPAQNQNKTLDYSLGFNGTLADLNTFLIELEKLPYYIKVSEIKYITPEIIEGVLATDTRNITLKMHLSIK